MVILALSMGSARGLIVLVVLALMAPAAAADAETPQIYARSGPDYTVAFKVEAGRTSVLALNAPIYCTFGHPPEQFPGTMYMFQGPTVMREGANGLEAGLRPGAGGGPSSYVRAKLVGERLAGTFALDDNEGSADCQTSDFLPAPPAVKFEAGRYEPAGGGATKSPGKEEVPIYYGSEGGVEVLLETTPESVDFRGAAPARCPVGGKKPAGGRVPLFGDIVGAKHSKLAGTFQLRHRRQGKIGHEAWSESRSVTGTIEDEAISGTYTRTTTIHPPDGSAPRRCTIGALPFRATRYLPAKG